MHETFALHRLGRADIAQARALNRLFGEAFDNPEAYGAEPASDYLEGLLVRDDIVALVALSGDEIVGGLVAYELDKLERARREVYLYDLAVADAHRRRGVATALITRLREIAAVRGASVVFVQADPEDDPAIALYTGLGTRQEVLHFDIPVARREPPPSRRERC